MVHPTHLRTGPAATALGSIMPAGAAAATMSVNAARRLTFTAVPARPTT